MKHLRLVAPFATLLFAAVPLRAAELCIVPSSNGLSATVDCDGHTRGTATTGFSTTPTSCITNGGFQNCNVASPLANEFVWSISSSVVNPFATDGPIGPGPTDLYLWLSTASGPRWACRRPSSRSPAISTSSRSLR